MGTPTGGFRPTHLVATLFAVHVLACLATAAAATTPVQTNSRRTSRRRRDTSRDRDILEELGYVNLLSGRPRFLTPGGRYSASARSQDPNTTLNTHNHVHHHDQRTRFHPHHAYDEQLPRNHPHVKNPHKSSDMTIHHVPPGRDRVTNNTLLRENLLRSAGNTQVRRVLPSHKPRGPPGGREGSGRRPRVGGGGGA